MHLSIILLLWLRLLSTPRLTSLHFNFKWASQSAKWRFFNWVWGVWQDFTLGYATLFKDFLSFIGDVDVGVFGWMHLQHFSIFSRSLICRLKWFPFGIRPILILSLITISQPQRLHSTSPVHISWRLPLFRRIIQLLQKIIIAYRPKHLLKHFNFILSEHFM